MFPLGKNVFNFGCSLKKYFNGLLIPNFFSYIIYALSNHYSSMVICFQFIIFTILHLEGLDKLWSFCPILWRILFFPIITPRNRFVIRLNGQVWKTLCFILSLYNSKPMKLVNVKILTFSSSKVDTPAQFSEVTLGEKNTWKILKIKSDPFGPGQESIS